MKAIYSIINKLTGERYIGSAVNFYNRKRLHLRQLEKNVHHSILLQRAVNKYKIENFEFIVLEHIENKEDLLKREQWWLDNTPNQYNICKIAGSSLGIKRSDETKEKCRKARLGEIHSEERRKKKSESQGGVNHWQYGKKTPKTVLDKKSKAMKQYYETHKSPKLVAVIQMDLYNNEIKEWESGKAAIEGLNLKITAKAISACVNGKSKKSGGYKWKKK